MMDSQLSLPADFLTFLAEARELRYDAGRCECGEITLLPLEQLQLQPFTILTDEMQFVYGDPHEGQGYYVVPGVNLVASCEDHDPIGILIWLPNERMFGNWDCDHHVVQVLVTRRLRGDTARIEAATWSDIEADPLRFINAQWGSDATTSKFLVPWPKYEWKPGRFW